MTVLDRRIDAVSVAVVVGVVATQVTLVVVVAPLWAVFAVLVPLRQLFLVEHNHVHRPIFVARAANAGFDTMLLLAGGIPPDFYRLQHVRNHHRYNNAAGDWTSPFRFRNTRYPDRPCSLLRYIATFAPAVYLRSSREILRRRNRSMLIRTLASTLVVAVVVVALALHNPAGVLVFFGIPWLLPSLFAPIANWRHHVGNTYTDALSSANNHLGVTGRLLGFNIGYHREHHHRPAAHWSDLPSLHLPIPVERS